MQIPTIKDTIKKKRQLLSEAGISFFMTTIVVWRNMRAAFFAPCLTPGCQH
jgi:hypothetical protein